MLHDHPIDFCRSKLPEDPTHQDKRYYYIKNDTLIICEDCVSQICGTIARRIDDVIQQYRHNQSPYALDTCKDVQRLFEEHLYEPDTALSVAHIRMELDESFSQENPEIRITLRDENQSLKASFRFSLTERYHKDALRSTISQILISQLIPLTEKDVERWRADPSHEKTFPSPLKTR